MDESTISVVCPGCQARMTAPAEFAGRTAKCPRCKAAVVVGPMDAPPRAEPPARPVKPPRRTATRVRATLADEPPPPRKGLVALWPGLLAGALVPTFGVVVALVVINAGGGGAPKPHGDPTAPPPAPPAPVRASAGPADSFAAVVDRVRTGLVSLPKEPLPPAESFDWDTRSSNRTTFAGELSIDIVKPVTYDVRAAPSLVTPYTGLIRFAARLNGRATGGLEREVQSPELPLPRIVTYRFALKVERDEDGEAEYGYKDGRWSLAGVRLTNRRTWTESEEPVTKNAFAALTANKMNQDQPLAGKVLKLDVDGELKLVRMLREAVEK